MNGVACEVEVCTVTIVSVDYHTFKYFAGVARLLCQLDLYRLLLFCVKESILDLAHKELLNKISVR